MPGKSDVKKLSKCIEDAHGNKDKRKACEDDFTAEGGTFVVVSEGGKVFTDAQGGKVFVTDGGKVF